jgi:hypothetical protein
MEEFRDTARELQIWIHCENASDIRELSMISGKNTISFVIAGILRAI